MYQVKASCGAPSFKPSNTTGAKVEYLEFDDDEIEKKPPQGQGKASNDTEKKGSPPQNGMPPRNASFERSDQQQ